MILRLKFVFTLVIVGSLFEAVSVSNAQVFESELQQLDVKELVSRAREQGDATRGAVLFFQPHMACSKCHVASSGSSDASENLLGPELSKLDKATTDASLVESLLFPSKVIRRGYESVTVITTSGTAVVGMLVEQTAEKLVIRDASRAGERVTFAMDDVELVKPNELSIMPAGQLNQLNSLQQFLDLIRYLFEIRDGGRSRALQLQPSSSLLAFNVPDYEHNLDHAGLVSSWNDEAFRRGEAIYQRVCANCHGTKEQPGSLPTSLRFTDGKFKNGSDPLSMYRTVTHGFGLMVPQTWMVPRQKYDVIHYIREAFLKADNPSQFITIDSAYLERLPRGDTFGPEPSVIEAWSAMDYGSSLANTYEVPGLKQNFAYKGIAIRLDPGAGGIARGRHWMIFDTDTLRAAAGWSASGKEGETNNFIDWRGIQFNGEHGIHPSLVGRYAFTNATGPGWSNPATADFVDDQRVLGRDEKRYGPLPRAWGRFKGLYHYQQQIILSYTIGNTEILEWPHLITRETSHTSPLMLRTFNIGPRDHELVLQVAEHPSSNSVLSLIDPHSPSLASLGLPEREPIVGNQKISLDGNCYLETKSIQPFDLVKQDFSVAARIRSKADGTIWSVSEGGASWNPDGQSLFIRNGKLVFDIGWVGAVTGKTSIADDRWHHVVLTWTHADKKVRLYVDGMLDGEGILGAKRALPVGVMRIGFTAPDFPRPQSFFSGEISQVRFYQRRLVEDLVDIEKISLSDPALVAVWDLASNVGSLVMDLSKNEHHTELRRRGDAEFLQANVPLIAGFAPTNLDVSWTAKDGNLRLRIPPGKTPLRFTVWLPASTELDPRLSEAEYARSFQRLSVADPAPDLEIVTRGGPSRWPQILETQASVGVDDGPFAVDVLTVPESNPWLAQMRLTGLDFFEDGRIAVCSWDGDIWVVTPATALQDKTLRWQRVATGLFQPLGLKIVRGKIHVICRDQLAVLHDLNDDGEIDYYQCLNNDHQVTEHFHEFAMGLQTDSVGNFYYAKSGCHGKAAIVPHHGTLLRVSPDGSKTDILANGFRAANGVCLNPDGSFFVTDQEGFWNPKNRVNWVTLSGGEKPKFYGNMLGYHDVTDTSDSAMVPPLCWITNAFDRSPAELLWVDSQRWGGLKGSLLNLSYGYGKVYLVPHERVNDLMQGGMIELPIPAFPTGIMRGRFHPADGQLYLCGMFAWAGSATQPGGLYRLRATGQPSNLPIGLRATKAGLKLTFSEAIDPTSLDIQRISVKTWSLKRTANYGSKHFDEQFLSVRGATLSADSMTILLDIEDLEPTWCMEIKYQFRSDSGKLVQGVIHNTIHQLAE